MYYGPFPSLDAAQKARFFSLDEQYVTRQICANGGPDPRAFIRCGIEEYDADEIAFYVADPECAGKNTFTVKPAAELSRHPSWAAMGMTSDGYYEYVKTGDTCALASQGDRVNIAAQVAARVTDAAVYTMAEERDCSTMDVRAALEAEAFSDITGLPLDYQTDWRDRLNEVRP